MTEMTRMPVVKHMIFYDTGSLQLELASIRPNDSTYTTGT